MDRRDLFLDARDRDVYLTRLARVLPEERVACFAWALLSNHVHLVLRTGDRPIGKAIHRVGTAYAGYFNDRYGHEGHVFQGRFGSRLVRDDGDLRNLIRYVHGNPLAAGLVDSLVALERFAWSGYAALCGRAPATAFHAIDETLALFGPSPCEARSELRRQMAETRTIEARSSYGALARLIGEVCTEHGVEERALRAGRKSHAASRARAAIARIARSELGLSDVVIAEALGVSRQALWRRIGARHASPVTS